MRNRVARGRNWCEEGSDSENPRNYRIPTIKWIQFHRMCISTEENVSLEVGRKCSFLRTRVMQTALRSHQFSIGSEEILFSSFSLISPLSPPFPSFIFARLGLWQGFGRGNEVRTRHEPGISSTNVSDTKNWNYPALGLAKGTRVTILLASRQPAK